MTESEIEDIFDVGVYRTKIETTYNVILNVQHFKTNKKWSDRMEDTFQGQGNQWNDRIKGEVKMHVAAAVAANPGAALNQHKRGSFDGLMTALESRLARLQ